MALTMADLSIRLPSEEVAPSPPLAAIPFSGIMEGVGIVIDVEDKTSTVALGFGFRFECSFALS